MTLVGWEPLEPYLTEAYCARCDSFGHTERKDVGWWCAVCWDWRMPLPSSLDRIIQQLLLDEHHLYSKS